ncbi:peptide chain release factor N(5)-glutamine methyltransferase [Patescibacteria group bacterium]|nr:peptide chain release factor N(5)-glutamine methyltransferase [Patescibacteria group bacterium]
MKISEALNCVDISRLEAEILLYSTLGTDRSYLLINPDMELSDDQESTFIEYIERRSKGEPIAYITGIKEFYGREFKVTSDVLIPRPSTEGLIDLAKDFLNNPCDEVRDVDNAIVCISKHLNKCSSIKTLVDIGTGSGCIAITLALEVPNIKIIATDVSDKALKVAKSNAEKHGVSDRIDFRTGSLLDPIADLNEEFLLVSNPPYVPDGEAINDEAQYEPRSAIFAGDEGLDLIEPLIKSAKNNSYCWGFVVECRREQAISL